MIPAPHGGRLVDRQLAAPEAERRLGELGSLPKLYLDVAQALDTEKIATGAYSPLDGFMDVAALQDVVTLGRLPGGLPWPLPIFLAPAGRENASTIRGLRPGDDVALIGPDGRFFAVLRFGQKFRLPKVEIARLVYDTTDTAHPDVAALGSDGETALAGRVDLLRPAPFPLAELELTPAAMRELFRARGWRTTAAYQTRSVPHLGHEQMQRLTLERSEIDGLLIHPVVGPTRPGDDRPEVVVASYRALIDGYYPASRVALATLRIPMRHAGGRAALFLAIVRQNFGCTHYIVGRDQAGFGDYYEPYSCHRIFDVFPLEITPVRYREFGYCEICRAMVSEKSCGHGAQHRSKVDRSVVHRAIAERRPVPEELLRPEVLQVLHSAGFAPLPGQLLGPGEPPLGGPDGVDPPARQVRDPAKTVPAG